VRNSQLHIRPATAADAGRALMSAFEQHAADQGCRLVALATRRAAAFYRALDYQESASYFRKVLGETSS
jgi:GNAT superfamily N-acetyltransferase